LKLTEWICPISSDTMSLTIYKVFFFFFQFFFIFFRMAG